MNREAMGKHRVCQKVGSATDNMAAARASHGRIKLVGWGREEPKMIVGFALNGLKDGVAVN